MILSVLSFLNVTFLFYTDPGSGALLLQLIMATVLGGLFYFRKLKDFLFKKRSSKDEKAVPAESSVKIPQE